MNQPNRYLSTLQNLAVFVCHSLEAGWQIPGNIGPKPFVILLQTSVVLFGYVAPTPRSSFVTRWTLKAQG